MSIERPVAASGLPAEPGLPPVAAQGREQMRLQILSTEHWSLLASRSLAWNEAFSRAGMYLTTLSGAIVALALIAQATQFGRGFLITSLVILPVVLFVGIATLVRLGASNYHDGLTVVGMNRIRHAYLELVPDLAPYFVMGTTDDVRGVTTTMGLPPGPPSVLHVLAATPAVVGVVNSVLVGVIVSIAALLVPLPDLAVLGLGIAAFVVAMIVFARYGRRAMERGQASIQPMFPTAVTTDGPADVR